MDTVAQKAVLSAHPVQHQIVNSLARIISIPENLPQEQRKSFNIEVKISKSARRHFAAYF